MKSNKKQNLLNIISNLFALVIQFAINFFVVPRIIKNLGTEAVGYVNLSTDIISYFSVITVIFNSVSGRFIAIEINKNNYKKASEYINSVILANCFISAAIALVGAFFIPNIDKVLNVSQAYLAEVKITFLITWISSILSIMMSVFTVGTFATNRLDVNAVRNIISYLIRIAAIILLFTVFPLKVYFMPVATLLSTIFLCFSNYNLTRKYLPEVELNIKNARKSAIKEIVSSGIWMSFTSLSNILMRNIDTLISNLLFGEAMMGNLSTSRTIPNAITTIINSIGTVFTPTFVRLYSQNKHDDLIEEAKNSIRVNGLIMIVPISGFIAFSNSFYHLWLKDLDSKTIELIIFLSTVTIIQAYFNSTTMALAQLSVVVNKLKLPVFVSFGIGVVNIVLEIALAKMTNIGITVLVIPSTILMVSRYFFFNSWYAAKILNTKAKAFYLTLIRTLLPIPVLLALFSLVQKTFTIDSWLKLLVAGAVCGVVGYIITFIIAVPKSYKKSIISAAINKIKSFK